MPTQHALPEGGLGNVIALPLQGMALKSGNSAFVDENWNAYEDQLKVLAVTRRLTRQEIEDDLSLWYSTGSPYGNIFKQAVFPESGYGYAKLR